jgi:hypothetical protein
MALYTIYNQVSGKSVVVTNLSTLSEESGLGKEKLVYHFTRLGKVFFREKGLIIIKSGELIKGKQRVSH